MLKINNISKTYKNGDEVINAVAGVTLEIEMGDYLTIDGASGAGKSTLLNMIGGLVKPDSGEILYRGNNIYEQKDRVMNEYRRRRVGFMFQQFHLMPYLTVLENIKLACRRGPYTDSITGYLEKCSLTGLEKKYPSSLSVGEKQRVAFIRAIISSPDVFLADEPTGNLDHHNGSMILSLIEEYQNSGGTVVLVSHDDAVRKYSNQQITMDKGTIISHET